MGNTATPKKKKVGKVLLMILLVIAVLIGALAGFIAYNASENMKVMNRTLDYGMHTLNNAANVNELDAGEYSEIKMYGVMKFDVRQYEVEELGNLSVMKVNMGFMQMVSYIITPYEKDMPMLSMDFMYILGNRKAYAEFYDLTADKDAPEYAAVMDSIREFESRYSDLEDIATEPAWYDDLLTVVLHKAGKKQDDDKIREMFADAIRTYMEEASGLELLDDEAAAEKLDITQEYCDDLVEKGGVSTDVFKKQLGEEKTKDFFNKVLFGTELYK
ncbi:MAG: hypothetical protein Q4A05_05350 [Ruminococcus sp.]|nr:hypothetical protein [Ruminococcus sp.]